MLEIRRIDEAAKPKKAFLMSGAFNPYTIGHEEAARQGVHAAKKTGHTHFYHGVGSSSQCEDAPLSCKQKRSVIKASHRHIKKDVKGIKMGVLPQEHDNPFKQVLHLAKTGHTHVTLGLGSDQMKKNALRGQLEKHVAKHGGMKDQDGKVHPVTLAFRTMGKKRDERPLHRTELLTRLGKGDLTVAKAGHLRKAVRTGDTELAHALMPKSVNAKKYHSMISNAQKKLTKKVHEGFVSFGEYIAETTTKKQKARARWQKIDHILRAQHHIAKNLGRGIDIEDQEPQARISHKSLEMARDSINRKLRKAVHEDISASVGFIPEAPELDPYIEPSESEHPHKYDKHFRDTKKRVLDQKREKYVSHRNLGEIHPGYELHRHVVTTHRYGARHGDPVVHSHRYTIVHKKTKDVAGEIDATAGKIDKKTGEHRPGTGKGLKIDWVGVHSDHSSKKVGKSLAIAAYKHLHNKGHSIKSDTRQSYGGAHVWNKLRHDPDVGHHVKFHDELDNKARPAHELSHGRIWQEFPSGQESTLVLHAKPRKKAVTEDIELIPVHRDHHVDKRKAADVHKAYGSKTYSSDKVVKRKNLGQIHPGYDLHQHSVEINTGRGSERAVKHRFTIVHRASGDVAGEMHAWGGKLHPIKGVVRGTKGKGLKVSHLEVHPDHREKKIGASLPVEMYRHLHRRGHAIQSDAIQSHGAAHVWNTMRHDRELKKHMMIHDDGTPVRGQVHSFEKRAHRRPERHIWYQHSRNWSSGREKVEGSHGDEPETTKTLILSGKKPKKKTVKEDIEMSQILNKPHGGYHRDFAKLVAGRGITPKRSGRIAKGYSLHTSKDKDDPKIENHHIVHDATGHVAGEVTTVTHGKDHTVIHTDVHGDHTQKKIGKSLAVLAYKHLARKKGSLKSSSLQSPGGASIWNRLRKDPKMRGRVFHSSTSGEVPAHDLPDKKIWASDLPVTKSKGTPEHLPAPRYSYHGATKDDKKEHSRVLGSRLVIRHPKKA